MDKDNLKDKERKKIEKDWREDIYKDCNKFFKVGESEIVIGKDLLEYGEQEVKDIVNALKAYYKVSNSVAVKDLLKDLYESYDPIIDLNKKIELELVCPKCKHKWIYAGKSRYYASCPMCRRVMKLEELPKKC
jgi:hypothetical protein